MIVDRGLSEEEFEKKKPSGKWVLCSWCNGITQVRKWFRAEDLELVNENKS